MTAGNDFITRAHALWRVRMAQWQQRFGFFARLVLLSGGAGGLSGGGRRGGGGLRGQVQHTAHPAAPGLRGDCRPLHVLRPADPRSRA